MRSSAPSTNTNPDHSAMYGHTFITDGHNPLPCAYNVHSAKPPFSAYTTPKLTITMLDGVQEISILFQDVHPVRSQRS
jgi:hypothetical protein